MSKPKIIAFYLPQYHPIPENDKWWGKGFTEWTNVGKAKPLFRGHYQPKVPADLGYYDLRLQEVREEQVELAKEAGIYGFCYWHYWFGNGKTLLSEILDDIIEKEKPDFPFCIGWANHDWTRKNWNIYDSKRGTELLIKQEYPGEEDIIKHFYNVLPAFKDKRYISVENRPLFLVYSPLDLPHPNQFIKIWNDLALKEGLKGIYFVGVTQNFYYSYTNYLKKRKKLIKNASEIFKEIFNKGFNGISSRGMVRAHYFYVRSSYLIFFNEVLKFILRKTTGIETIKKYDYKLISKLLFTPEEEIENIYPTIIPNWDRTPRSGKMAQVWHKSTPKIFKEQVEKALKIIKNRKKEHQILFLLSWNEWAEGNYMEPDLKFGKEYIHALRDALSEFENEDI